MRSLLRACLALGCLAGCSLSAQTPTVSNITISELDTSSFRILYNVTGVSGAWAEVYYGTQSGVYPYNSKSISCYNRTDPCQTSGGITALSVTGLKPGTTYYVLATARPDPNDDAGVCNTSSCGAVEQMVTTLAGPQPSPPVPPNFWAPTLPDTSSYAVIPLQVGSTGECQAAQTVTNGTWTVSAGTYLGSAIGTVGFGTVFEVPQGVSCRVPGDGYNGYGLPGLPADNNCGGPCSMTDPRHRWIVFRTKQLAATDFPPFGSRISPDFSPLLGKFYSSQPNKFSQLFNADESINSVHHIWFENIEFLDDPNYTNPPNYVDPVGFNLFARMGSSFQNQNNEFLVFDRVYAHGPGAPIRHVFGYELSGNYLAMVGCYTSHIETWRLTLWPANSGSLNGAGNVLTIPQNNFRYSVSSAVLGMAGPASLVLNSAAVAGTIVGNLYADHLEIQYTPGISLTCSGCTLTANATPTTPPTALALLTGSVTATSGGLGQFTNINWNTQEYQTSQYLMGFGIMNGDLQSAGGPYDFDNNYIDGVGEGFYVDAEYSPYSGDDITYTHNHQIWPKQYFASDPGNQWRYEVRQHWEVKRAHRVLLKGNLFSYSWSYQNQGSSIFVSARSTYIIQPGNDGVSDINIQSNIISHGRGGIDCMGSNPLDNAGTFAEPAPGKRVQITNNLMFDLGRWLYCDPVNCPGLGSHYFANRPGCQDLVVENNTAGPSYGELPDFMDLGGGQNLGNYLSFQKNVLYVSKGVSGYGGANFGDWPANNVQNHDVKPAPTYSDTGSNPNFLANLSQSFVNTTATVTPNFNWGHNLLIGGWEDTNGTLAGIIDLSASDLQQYTSLMPTGDSYPSGNTIAARQNSAGLANPSAFNYSIARTTRFSPGGVGVDYEKLAADQGEVTSIQTPQVSPSAVEFNYTAPDSRACIVDIGPSGSWGARATDTGGQRQRTVIINGLQPGSNYQYRILCYYKQVNDGVLYTDYLANQTTNGTFQTAPAAKAVLAEVPFSLRSVSHAAKVQVTLTPVTGSPATQVCTTSPCTLTVNSGDYTMQIQYLSSAGATLSSGSGHLKF